MNPQLFIVIGISIAIIIGMTALARAESRKRKTALLILKKALDGLNAPRVMSSGFTQTIHLPCGGKIIVVDTGDSCECDSSMTFTAFARGAKAIMYSHSDRNGDDEFGVNLEGKPAIPFSPEELDFKIGEMEDLIIEKLVTLFPDESGVA